MNIQLLFAGLMVSGAALAQTVEAPTAITNPNTSGVVGKAIKPLSNHSSASAALGDGNIDETIIGTTYYDLQTNNAVQPRFVVHANGTMSAAWTFSHDSDGDDFPDRGTGYNFYDGTSWGAQPTERLDPERVGWPSLVALPGGGEAYMAHTSAGGSQFAKRDVAGTGTWAFSDVTNGSKTLDLVWHRMAVGGADGNSLHVIGAENLGEGSDAEYFMRYARSTDLGTTWDIVSLEIPGIEDTTYGIWSGDSYSIVSDGDNVDFIVGGVNRDVILMSSTDNGTTWSKNIIWDFPIENFDDMSDLVDSNTTPGNEHPGLPNADQSFNLMYDATGELHAFFGAYVFANTDTTSEGSNFFPGLMTELLHWKGSYGFTANGTATADGSVDGFTQLDTVAQVEDLNGDGAINGAIATYFLSLSSMPSSFVASNGDIYLTYSSIIDTLTEDQVALGDEYAFNSRHQFITRSQDNGVTWSEPKDMLAIYAQENTLTEAVYGNVVINDDVCYVMYQRDIIPGLHVRAPQGEEHEPTENEIVVASFLLSDYDVLFMDETNEGVFTMAPNPATDVLNINLVEGYESANITIVNALGQELYAGQVEGLTHTISVAGFQSGLYIVNVIEGNEIYSHKLMVK
ncbi:MAG: T9SS type A sorting domain-containing protein [Flavobacteriales bacterium]